MMKNIQRIDIRGMFRQAVRQVRKLPGNVLSWPSATWVLFAYFAVFFFYFIIPTYLNAYHELRLFPNFPVLQPLGADLHEYLNFSKLLLDTGTPYIPPNYYPPFQAVFFLRLMYSGPDQSYIYLTILSFLSLLAITWLYPMFMSKGRKLTPLAVFGVVTGLFSYGLWFEIERGQFDLLVMAICFAGIYLYHRHPKLRLVAYLLFVMSVNIKLYPLIFILCFTSDWQDWKGNLRRWGLLLLANFAGLFVLGWKVFLDFYQALMNQLNAPSFWGPQNHSIDSFLWVVMDANKSIPGLESWMKFNFHWLELALLIPYLLCLGAVFWLSYRRRMSAANPYLILLLTIGALIIPSTSHDYKLCIFITPFVLLFNSLELRRTGKYWLDLSVILLVLIFSLAYSATLFLHEDLPLLLTNNFPALMIVSITAALLAWARAAQARRLGSSTEFPDLN